jgi:hypothetical protein
MKTFILAAVVAVTAGLALAGLAQAQTCFQTCTPTYNGGYSCTVQCI